MWWTRNLLLFREALNPPILNLSNKNSLPLRAPRFSKKKGKRKISQKANKKVPLNSLSKSPRTRAKKSFLSLRRCWATVQWRNQRLVRSNKVIKWLKVKKVSNLKTKLRTSRSFKLIREVVRLQSENNSYNCKANCLRRPHRQRQEWWHKRPLRPAPRISKSWSHPPLPLSK